MSASSAALPVSCAVSTPSRLIGSLRGCSGDAYAVRAQVPVEADAAADVDRAFARGRVQEVDLGPVAAELDARRDVVQLLTGRDQVYAAVADVDLARARAPRCTGRSGRSGRARSRVALSTPGMRSSSGSRCAPSKRTRPATCSSSRGVGKTSSNPSAPACGRRNGDAAVTALHRARPGQKIASALGVQVHADRIVFAAARAELGTPCWCITRGENCESRADRERRVRGERVVELDLRVHPAATVLAHVRQLLHVPTSSRPLARNMRGASKWPCSAQRSTGVSSADVEVPTSTLSATITSAERERALIELDCARAPARARSPRSPR